MNELDLLKMLAGLGPAGIIGAVLIFAAQKLMKQTSDSETRTYAEMSKRIDALEVAVRDCDKDRRELREQFINSLQDGDK